jgi:hypothetical protein
MKRIAVTFLAAAGLLLVAGTCKKEVVPERQWERGFFKPYLGKEFTLNGALHVTRIIAAEDEIPASALPLAMTVTNETSRRVSTHFPSGLVFEPTNLEYQYMIILQDFYFSVPAQSETLIDIPTYCCNEDLDEPDDESFYRKFEIQVWERELNDLIDIVRDKRLEGDTAVPLAQDALFEITDGDGLTDATRAALESLP